MTYATSQEVLRRYARLLVRYALGGGEGIKPGDVVQVTCPDSAKPLYVEACRAVWEAGGQVIDGYYPDDEPGLPISRIRYEAMSEEQLDFFPATYFRGLVDQADHSLHIIAENDPNALQEVAPERLMRLRRSRRPLVEWRNEKENAGRFTWTIGLYPTEAMAAEARMSLEEYWEQVKLACFLDEADPVAKWREVNQEIEQRAAWLNSLPIKRLHVEGEDADLWITLGERRKWMGGGGANIPSFEVFTSPDWRGTEGRIRFSEPLYIYGSLINGVELEFEQGRVVRASAQENEALLKEMIATENADRVGEFSLTDARLSRINRFMANTLYDENVGGPFGNTHVAVGMAIKQCYDGDPGEVSPEEWERLGFNDSVVHTDIVSTTDRIVTAVLRDGGKQVIYRDGQFTGV
ncbi:MAG TPA: aminopeptidase [Solirubrobacteraceae bacterium]|jgi:aminopeptidase|nr:aminopeptidase [Solirubrobacteraceae bacterium]